MKRTINEGIADGKLKDKPKSGRSSGWHFQESTSKNNPSVSMRDLSEKFKIEFAE